MKVIGRRLRRLEERFVPKKDHLPDLAAILRERYRRRMEHSVQPYVEEPPDLTDYRGLSIAEILRSRSDNVCIITLPNFHPLKLWLRLD
jgi:hypothetical protein